MHMHDWSNAISDRQNGAVSIVTGAACLAGGVRLYMKVAGIVGATNSVG